ncbi:hypothetical protein [Allomesorhizobium camelthorni]|nr:hypothetical protein [Mesorhizobium camelthorni]
MANDSLIAISVTLHFSDGGKFCDAISETPVGTHRISVSFDEGLEMAAIGRNAAGGLLDWLEKRVHEYEGQSVERFPLSKARRYAIEQSDR